MAYVPMISPRMVSIPPSTALALAWSRADIVEAAQRNKALRASERDPEHTDTAGSASGGGTDCDVGPV
jgi:hypothetical protein